MESIVLIIALTISNIACLYIGVHISQKVEHGEKIEVPKLNPLKAWQDRKEEKEIQSEEEKLKKIYENAERYNGTAEGQQDIEQVSKWI